MRVVGIEYEDQYGNCTPLDPPEATNMANLHPPEIGADTSMCVIHAACAWTNDLDHTAPVPG